MVRCSAAVIKRFRATVYAQARAAQRQFPWRLTTDAYAITVSEIMLQQTQVSRVSDKFTLFMQRFPTVESLAQASLADVLAVWQGLGYNRRAKLLHACAKTVIARHDGVFPRAVDALAALPGIGRATAGAIAVYAYDQPETFIETNIRAVFIHHFFKRQTAVNDKDIMPLVQKTLDTAQPRQWYNALMDYGTALKARHKNPARKSAHYKKQSCFIGSDRQIRGAIIRELVAYRTCRQDVLLRQINAPAERITVMLGRMEQEKMIRRYRNYVSISEE